MLYTQWVLASNNKEGIPKRKANEDNFQGEWTSSGVSTYGSIAVH